MTYGYTTGFYYMPFFWPYLHVLAFVLLLGASMPVLLIPGGIFMVLLYFFPKVGGKRILFVVVV